MGQVELRISYHAQKSATFSHRPYRSKESNCDFSNSRYLQLMAMQEREGREEFLHRMASWDHLIQVIANLENVSGKEKRQLTSRVLAIRDVLGGDWLQQCLQNQHPIMWMLVPNSVESKRKLARFGENLSLVSGARGFEHIRPHFAKPREFDSTVAQMDIAIRYMRAGHSIEFEPSTGKKKADVSVDMNPRLFVEIKLLGASQVNLESNVLNEKVWERVREGLPPLEVTGVIHEVLAPPHEELLMNQIDAARRTVAEGKPVERIYDEGNYELYVFSRKNERQVPKPFQHSLASPSFNSSEKKRVCRLIGEASGQLPKGNPGIVVLPGLLSIGDASIHKQPEQAAEYLYQTVYKYPNIVAAVVLGQNTGRVEPRYENHARFQIFQRMDSETSCENGVIIKNRFPDFQFERRYVRPIATHETSV